MPRLRRDRGVAHRARAVDVRGLWTSGVGDRGHHFRAAADCRAAAVVLFHNHPSGDRVSEEVRRAPTIWR